MRVGGVSPKIVGLARWYELTFGRFGDSHLTVSETMKQDLLRIIPTLRPESVHVLYDRATAKFTSGLTLQDKSELLTRIQLDSIMSGQTYKKDRPALLLSSTSYTPDEDFMVLVNALDEYDADPTNKQKV